MKIKSPLPFNPTAVLVWHNSMISAGLMQGNKIDKSANKAFISMLYGIITSYPNTIESYNTAYTSVMAMERLN